MDEKEVSRADEAIVAFARLWPKDGATRDYGVGNPGELLVLAKTED